MTAIPSRKKKGNGCARGWCGKMVPVKFKDPKFKHEMFMRMDMKHSYFSLKLIPYSNHQNAKFVPANNSSLKVIGP